MALSVLDGVLYALMVGFGETYFVANAVRLGASALELGLVVALPLCVGALGPLLALARLARVRHRKPLVVFMAGAQVAALLGIAALDDAALLGPRLLIAVVCLYQVLGQAAGTAWSSWFGDVVPAETRGRYFARRNRAVHIASCAGVIAAGALLQRLEPGAAGTVAAGAGGAGFRIALLLAAGFRAASVVALALSPEPRFRGLPRVRQMVRYVRTQRGTMAWRLLATTATLQFWVYLASPYFGPYMLESLHFTYLQYMAASVAVVVAKSTMLGGWGRVVDQHGARGVYGLVAILVAIVPLPWLWASGLGWVIFAQALSGFSWAGYEVSHFTLLLEASYKPTRPIVFAALNAGNGSAQLLGSLAGATLLVLGGGDMRVLFLASTVGRLLVGLLLPRLVPFRRGAPAPGRRVLLLRVIGFRPHGGLVHRPVLEAEEEE